MHRHRDVGIGLGDVDEVQIELSTVGVIRFDGRDILECQGWEDEVDVSWDDQFDASGMNDEITAPFVRDGEGERGGQIGGHLRSSTSRCDGNQDHLNIHSRFVLLHRQLVFSLEWRPGKCHSRSSPRLTRTE